MKSYPFTMLEIWAPEKGRVPVVRTAFRQYRILRYRNDTITSSRTESRHVKRV